MFSSLSIFTLITFFFNECIFFFIFQNAELQILMKASDADTSNVNAIIAEFESKRVNKITSTGELFNRFPSLAKEIETNLSKHDFNPNLSSNVKEHH